MVARRVPTKINDRPTVIAHAVIAIVATVHAVAISVAGRSVACR